MPGFFSSGGFVRGGGLRCGPPANAADGSPACPNGAFAPTGGLTRRERAMYVVALTPPGSSAMTSRLHNHLLTLAALSFACAAIAPPAQANHSWNGYHWAWTSDTVQFSLKLGDNVTFPWDTILATTSSDWTLSDQLSTTVVPGAAGAVKKCRANVGRVEVCNTTYGNNGWLGVAQIWISGAHITQGTVKVNDTYFKTAKYNTTAWRNLVMCQEVGHTFGLDHQDENFSNTNLGTCMDYTNFPDSNQHPNAHDYAELADIYDHADGSTTLSQSTAQAPAGLSDIDLSEPQQWGKLVKQSKDGRHATYARDFGGGHQVHTFVIWADEKKAKKD
jgi:hypothetical protein